MKGPGGRSSGGAAGGRPPSGAGDHPTDALSALLDAELAAADELVVRAHLAGCPACAAELHAVAEARSWVRGLPAVDPPFGFYERLLATPRRRRWAAASLVAAAAASVAFVGVLPAREAPVNPAVATLIRTHAVTASVDGDPVSQLATVGVPMSFRR
jgi:anti-sigma factor RsiW